MRRDQLIRTAHVPTRFFYFSVNISLSSLQFVSMRNLIFTLLTSLLLSTIPGLTYAMPAEVLLIRHAEKPTEGDEGMELSEKGWLRANALPQLFKQPEFKNLMERQVVLIAMAQKRPNSSIRPIQTLKYLSESLMIKIETPYTRDDYQFLVNQLRKNPYFNNKTVIICWEGTVLSSIAKSLGVFPVPELRKRDFDRAWVVSFNQNGAISRFQDLPQRLLPNDPIR